MKITSKGLKITVGTMIAISVIIFGAGKWVGTTNQGIFRIEEKVDNLTTKVDILDEKVDILVYDVKKRNGDKEIAKGED